MGAKRLASPASLTGVRTFDLSADLGEGMASDAALLEVVTSASVACGFHAGDETTMAAVCAAAARRGVVVGAHVGYADREGFGRRELGVAAADLKRQADEQIAALAAAAAAAGTSVRYLKPHGALYHRCAVDADAAAAMVAAASAAGLSALLGAPGSELLTAAENAGLAAIAEGFADRRYVAAGGLAGRGTAGAVLSLDDATQQALTLARGGFVVTANGSELAVAARSICVHGDSPSATRVARAVRDAIEEAGLTLAPFA